MGSVVISDVVYNTTHPPHTMLAGRAHRGEHTGNDSDYAATSTAHPSHLNSSNSTASSRQPAGAGAVQRTANPLSRPQYSDPLNAPQLPLQYASGLPIAPTRANTQPYPPEADYHADPLDQRAYSADPYMHSTPPDAMWSDNSPQAYSTQHASSSSSAAGSFSSPTRIVVRDLSHIQSFATEEFLARSRSLSTRRSRHEGDAPIQYEISSMPVTDVIEMVAGLLTKITTTNDRQHEHLHRHIPPPEGTSNLPQQTSSVLAFHGKNVPSISILSYLTRIHKYCPTTYEVFLSLLVYFDRMAEMVNSGPMRNLRQASQQNLRHSRHSSETPMGNAPSAHSGGSAVPAPLSTPPLSGSVASQRPTEGDTAQSIPSEPPLSTESYNMSHFFVVDSFNIHRLVIAGVTCASKFFSDVFYTNSRYAKVGGLPLAELNHLELQFLILNDFRLSVPVEDLEAYGTMLVEFYAREVIAQRQAVQQGAQFAQLMEAQRAGMRAYSPPG